MYDRSYRSKPPSAVRRDTMRQEAWLSSISEHGATTYTPQASGIFTNNAHVGNSYVDHDSGLASEHAVDKTLDTFASSARDVLITEPLHETTSMHAMIPECTHTNSDYSGPNVCQVETQTKSMTSSYGVQTDAVTIKQNVAIVQCPSLKKKGTQTITVSKVTQNQQTECIKYVDKDTASDLIKTTSTQAMTDNTNSVDVAVITEPPIGRHVQTDDTNHTLKGLGRNFKHIGTQFTESRQYKAGANLKDIQQAKASMASAIAERAIGIKMMHTTRTVIGHVT